MVSLNRTRLGTAVAASPFVFPQELFPVLHADEIAAGRGASGRLRRLLGAVALDDQGPLRVGEHEELEVVVSVRDLLEAGENLGQRLRRLLALASEMIGDNQQSLMSAPQLGSDWP